MQDLVLRICSTRLLQLGLRNHNPVWIPIALTDMDFDVLIIQCFKQLITHAIFGALFAADFLPLSHTHS